jgi:hypothetical protein
MSSESEHRCPRSEALDPIERALSNFSAAPPQIDRDRLMFLAGQASAEASREAPGDKDDSNTQMTGKLTHPARLAKGDRLRWLWPASTAALAAISLGLLLILVVRPASQPLIVYRERPAVKLAAQQPRRESTAEIPSALPVAVHAAHLTADSYLRTRDVALRMGLDALGSPAAFSGGLASPTYGELLQGLAPRTAGDTPPQKTPSNM